MPATANLNLKVTGSIIVYRDSDKVEVTEAVPQGFNPNILILHVKIKEGSGPMKGTDRMFTYETSDNVKHLTNVTLIYPDGRNETISVV